MEFPTRSFPFSLLLSLSQTTSTYTQQQWSRQHYSEPLVVRFSALFLSLSLFPLTETPLLSLSLNFRNRSTSRPPPQTGTPDSPV